MNFYQYSTAYEFALRLAPKLGVRKKDIKREGPINFYASTIMRPDPSISEGTTNQFQMEMYWYKVGRPYYNIWPGIIPSFRRLRLDIDSGQISPGSQDEPIVLKFPMERNPFIFQWGNQEWTVRCVFLVPCLVRNVPGFTVYIDIDEPDNMGCKMYTYRNVQCAIGKTFEDSLDGHLGEYHTARIGVQVPDTIIRDVIRTCVAVRLLENDSEILIPVDDPTKYKPTKGKFKGASRRGWNVGMNISQDPHAVAPYFAIRHTGKGGKILKLRRISGYVTHRELIEKIPTGYEKEETE